MRECSLFRRTTPMFAELMGTLGQSQTFDDVCIRPLSPPIADSCPTSDEVRDVPKADIHADDVIATGNAVAR